MYIMKTRVKRGGLDTDDEYNTPTATPESDNITDYTWDSWYDDRFTEDTDKETTSTPEYNDELDEGFLENNEDTETDENNQFDDEGDVLPQDLDDLLLQIHGANQAWGGKRRKKSNKRKSNKRKSRRVKRRKSNKRNKSRKVKKRKSNKKRYMRGGQPALTAGTMTTDRVTGYVEPTYRM